MKHTVSSSQRYRRASLIAPLLVGLLVFASSPLPVVAQSLTTLINTESFDEIDTGDGTTDIELRFGGTTNRLYFDTGSGRFIFSTNLGVTGDLDVTGTASGDTVHAEKSLTSSGALSVEGTSNLQGALTFGSLLSCPNLQTDASGNVSCNNTDYIEETELDTITELEAQLTDVTNVIDATEIDTESELESILTDVANLIQETEIDTEAELESILTDVGNLIQETEIDSEAELEAIVGVDFATLSQADDRFVNQSGDTMTGQLLIAQESGSDALSASGALKTESGVVLNYKNAAQDAVLTFGNDAGAETLRFSDTSNKFEFSNDVEVNGNLSGASLTVSSGAVSINNVSYSFTGTQGGANTVLTNDGSGNLTWASTDSVEDGSGSFLSLHPEYPNVIYEPDGSSNVGRLRLSGSTLYNLYTWNTTRPSLQDYDIVVRVQVPYNFTRWSENAIELNYRTDLGATANNSVRMQVFDTAEASDDDSGVLANTTFTTETVLGTDLGGTYTPGDYMTIRITPATDNSGQAVVGYLNINWETTTP